MCNIHEEYLTNPSHLYVSKYQWYSSVFSGYWLVCTNTHNNGEKAICYINDGINSKGNDENALKNML